MLFFHWHFNLKLLWPTGMKQDKGNHIWERKRAISFLYKSCHLQPRIQTDLKGECEPLHYIQTTSSPFLLKSAEAEVGLLLQALVAASFLVGTTNVVKQSTRLLFSAFRQLSIARSFPPSHCSITHISFSRMNHLLLLFWSILLLELQSLHPYLCFFMVANQQQAETIEVKYLLTV